MRYYVHVSGEQRMVEVTPAEGGRYKVALFRKVPTGKEEVTPDLSFEVDAARTDDVSYLLNLGGDLQEARVLASANQPAATVCLGGRTFELECRTELEEQLSQAGRGSADPSHDRQVRARMPGKVVAVHAKPGDVVERGSRLIVLEAMKMENEIQAQGPGKVAVIHVKPGDAVDSGALLVELAPEEA